MDEPHRSLEALSSPPINQKIRDPEADLTVLNNSPLMFSLGIPESCQSVCIPLIWEQSWELTLISIDKHRRCHPEEHLNQVSRGLSELLARSDRLGSETQTGEGETWRYRKGNKIMADQVL
jgi:hypothetical protein